MSDTRKPKAVPSEPIIYQIRISGHLDAQWADWFGDMPLTLEDNGDTLLLCPVVDQSALYGLLRKVRDLGIPLVSINRVESNSTDESNVEVSG